jgi:hypothetical protein
MTNHTHTTSALRSKARHLVPGDTARILTAPATSFDGVTYPKGTVYQPLSCGRHEQTVTILADGRAERAVFAR